MTPGLEEAINAVVETLSWGVAAGMAFVVAVTLLTPGGGE